MSWIAITTDTLNEARVAALVEACSTAALADGQDSRAAGLIQGVVTEIRRKVASCPRNRVDADETKIPAGLRDMAVDLILARLKGAVEIPLTEDERANVARHERNLNRIASCDDTVDQPDAPVEPAVENSIGFQTIGGKRNFTRDKMGGLV